MDTDTTQETKFIYRRLEESLRLFGRDFDPWTFWLSVLTVVLAVGFVYVILMYRRDSRTVGWPWASLLGFLRCTVYAILAWIFLLPAEQVWDRTELHSRVVLGFDISGSMRTKDDPPSEATPVDKLPTRLDKVLYFLTKDDHKFVRDLHRLNPLAMYRFGSRVDDDVQSLPGGKMWTNEDWWTWFHPNPKEQMPDGLSEEDQTAFKRKMELYRQLVGGTNLNESLLRVTNREFNNMVQGLVVFSDGRNTLGTTQPLKELQARAARAKIPIFVVAVGEHRQPINIRITDLQAPEQTRPDDKFPIRVHVDGEGLPNHETAVVLEVTNPRGEKKPLPARKFKFDAGQGGPPHAQIEFEIDAIELGVPVVQGQKPELEEGEWIVQARVPRDKREIFTEKEHVSEKATITVIKKPLRVLLFADAATRDFQFVRSMFVREVDQRRAELSVCLQLQRSGVVQDVPGDRLLKHFPNRLGEDTAGEKPEERYYNLSQYDLIVAFDPDWSQLSPEQMGLLERWVRQHAGGLVFVGGPIHTVKLAQPGAASEKYRQILDLYPVQLLDITLQNLVAERSTTEPWRLRFPGATSEMEFLRLDDEAKDAKDMLAGWEEFFTGQPKGPGSANLPLQRGFFGFYPVKMVKPPAIVIATFTDPRARMADGKEQPYLVLMPYGSGKTLYISSGETYRLRMFREAFHERFWTKLGRYAGSGTLSRLSKRGVLVMGREFTANSMVRIDAQLFGREMQPLPVNATPRLQLKPPAGVQMATNYTMKAKPSQGAEWNGWFQSSFRVLQAGEYRVELTIPETGDILPGKFMVKESDPELDNTQPDYGELFKLASDYAEVSERFSDLARKRDVEEALVATAARLVQQRPDDKKPDGASKESAGPKLLFDLDSAHLIPECMSSDSRTQRNRGRINDFWDRGLILSGESLRGVVWWIQTILIFAALLLFMLIMVRLLANQTVRPYMISLAGTLLALLPLLVIVHVLPREWVMPWGRTPEGMLVTKPGEMDERVLILSFIMFILVGLLALEWVTRKLLKLA